MGGVSTVHTTDRQLRNPLRNPPGAIVRRALRRRAFRLGCGQNSRQESPGLRKTLQIFVYNNINGINLGAKHEMRVSFFFFGKKRVSFFCLAQNPKLILRI